MKRMARYSTIALTLLPLYFLAFNVLAAESNSTTLETAQLEDSIAETKKRIALKKEYEDLKKQETKINNELNPISSLGFDIGIAAEWYGNPYVSNASIGGDGIVRITESYDVQPSFWLQFSWLADGGTPTAYCSNSACFGLAGVYSGIKIAGQNSTSLDAASLGIAIASFKLGLGDMSQSSTIKRFYVGVGGVVHKTRSLANDITAGQSLPTGLTQIEYEDSYDVDFQVMLGLRF